ncbi:related to CUE3 Meiotic induced gene, has a CUE domain that binds ubiquitin [Lecanosticta acicola]|uniref:Related to CUE3 Meiotic induced gene, has a CUE domain that binds ubiquitin n=1 Tax=Lecanosticta acicola TaxID=111012 RepID=A0AAI9EFH8_9PEZI|nr:related to CUE3 Meiotic induced gene, has a CUE domain that binds ubiquitin [Lecanosticta acicola]
MDLPPFAPLPPSSIRLSLGPEEWEACLEAWLTLAQLTLRLPATDFDTNTIDKGPVPHFLASFYRELNSLSPGDGTLSTPRAISLRKALFKVASRAFREPGSLATELLSWSFLSNFCHVHVKSPTLQQLMSSIWKRKSETIAPSLQKQKDLISKQLESKDAGNGFTMLSQLAPIMHASADIGAFFMTGSDFLDSLVSAYSRSTSDPQKKSVSTVIYLGLISCVRTEVPNTSLLSDHLYTLKSQADKAGPGQAVLADVVTNTTVISRIQQSLSGKAPERVSKLLDTLETYRAPSVARPRKAGRPRSKGKGKQKSTNGDLHIHKMSLVTQVQDLFPDLGSGFVLKLLDEYGDNVEQVTAHLLDDSLPPQLASLDRNEGAWTYDSHPNGGIVHLPPRSTPPPPNPFSSNRRNVFDDDELDRLEFDTNRLHIGKQDRQFEGEDAPNKAAILSALAAFDSDDDERDDTYDVEDVGGTVDTSHPDGEPGPAARVFLEENDMALFNAYQASPELFGRTFDVRKGQARQALKAETGMTDEAIEGWAIMLQRDPKRLKRLEAQTGAFDGRQAELPSTAYRESPGNTETEDSDVAQQGGRGGFRGRGRGRGRGGRGRGRGGNVAGPSSDPTTANAQRRKEASKGSRANHNRRDQRAKKMARGGFPG